MNELKLLLLKKGIFAIAGLGVFLVLLSSFGGSNNLKHNSSDSIVPSPVSMDDTDIGQTAQTVYSNMEKSHQKMLNDEKAFDEKKAKTDALIDEKRASINASREANEQVYSSVKDDVDRNKEYVKENISNISPEVAYGHSLMKK